VHLLLTDRLTCPRCGPDFGLILLAERTEARQVLDGTLGCPNCRDAFPVRDGFADLRAPPRSVYPAGRAGPPVMPDAEEGRRIAALLGVDAGPGTVALVGAPARHAAHWGADPDLQVVAVDADVAAWPEVAGVSRMVVGPGLPFRSRALRGVCVDGALEERWIAEAARVVAPRCRVVVLGGPFGAGDALEAAGLRLVAREAGTVVAARA
jgi:uncharacterized protein YbaR (Trm112 family)